jgi:hypothetical protein
MNDVEGPTVGSLNRFLQIWQFLEIRLWKWILTKSFRLGMIPISMAKRIIEAFSFKVMTDAVHTRFEWDGLEAVVEDLHAINNILWCPDKFHTQVSTLMANQIPYRVVRTCAFRKIHVSVGRGTLNVV